MAQMTLTVAKNETDRIRVLTFAALSGDPLPAYTPGAHIDFDLGQCGKRSYSLIDWPCHEAERTTFTIAVQREENGEGGSKAMHALCIGDKLEVAAPQNDFELKDINSPVLLLAGGIGVTPLISMATKLQACGRDFTFHYAARSTNVMGFKDKLMHAFCDQMHLYFDDERPIDLDLVMAGQARGTQIYICGPKGMIEAAKNAAQRTGHAEDAVHVELFSAPQSKAGDQPFEVEIKETGDVYIIPVGKTIIEVLESAGMDLMYDCQRGDCGICQTDVLSGTPDHRDVVLSEADRASGKVMQICVSRSLSSRLILDL